MNEENKKQRTIPQNKSIHVYFSLMSEAFNEAGYDFNKVIEILYGGPIKVPWTPDLVKNEIWRPIQITAIDKESTASLSTEEIDYIYRIVDRNVAEMIGISIAFPKKRE